MKADFLVLGASGMQGKIVVADLLHNNYTVHLADLYKEGSEPFLKKYPRQTDFDFIDLRDKRSTVNLIRRVDPAVVINCAEGDWNLNVYYACLEMKKHVLDLGSEIPMTKEQIALGPFFKEDGLTAITGCGSTPGINNILLHHAHELFDSIHTVEVGFAWDSNIKKFVVPFSIQSIVEEFTDPAPIIEDGEWIDKVPLESVVEREFREIGKQRCFFVRHPETYTFYLYYQNEGLKNMRFYAGFPEHSFKTIHTFIETGLASKDPIEMEGKKIIPIDVLTRTLRDLGRPNGYTEKENLWVQVEGVKNSEEKTVLMECIVNTLPGWEEAGCNIDTGFPASIMAQMVKNGEINTRGSFVPGFIVPKDKFFKELRKKQMTVYQDGAVIN